MPLGTRNALTRTGLVAAFLATAGVVAVEQNAHADGIVRCWGYNGEGQCNTPADLGACSSVAGGGLHTIALTRLCPGDFDGDNAVEGSDLGTLLGSWGPCAPGAPGDMDNNGTINGADLGALLGAWGPCVN